MARGRRSVAGSSVIVMAGLGSSAILGFVLQVLLARFYGTRAEMDVFLNASTVPTVLLGGLNIALATAATPVFSEYLNKGSFESLRSFATTILSTVFVLMSIFAALGWAFAPVFVPFIARGFPQAEQALDVQMVRLLMPSIIATGVAGVAGALLQVYNRFVPTALTFVVANVVMIASVVALHQQLGIFALVYGTLAGIFAQLFVQLPFIFRLGLYRCKLDWRHRGLTQIWPLLLPSFVSASTGQINLSFDRYFASTLSSGSTSAMVYTLKLTNMPLQIVVTALGTVVFPLIARHFAASDHAAMRRSIGQSLSMISLFMVPCAAGLWVLAHPIVQTLFERGAFGPSATALCASFIPFACLSLLATSYNSITGRACSASKQNKKTAVVSVSAVSLNVALSAVLVHVLGVKGLLLANGAAGCFFLICHLGILSRLLDGLEWRPFLSSTARVTAAALIMTGALLGAQRLGLGAASTVLARVLSLAALIALGSLVFLVCARLMGVKELALAVRLIKGKVARQPPEAA